MGRLPVYAPLFGPVTVTAQDLDGDVLSFNIFYSRDNGLTWLPLETNLSGGFSYTADMSLLPGCQTCRVKVEASDGFKTGSDVTDTSFGLADNPPLVKIVDPVNGATELFPAMVRGYALDPEDGSLTDSSLVWSSNVDGPLGIGSPLQASLSEGEHILTLTANDSSGNSTSVSATIRVFTHYSFYLSLIRR